MLYFLGMKSKTAQRSEEENHGNGVGQTAASAANSEQRWEQEQEQPGNARITYCFILARSGATLKEQPVAALMSATE
jgi:hypothetical protein